MVAMDFFAALNCYDFLNQYCSNLLKNPTVRGLTRTQAIFFKLPFDSEVLEVRVKRGRPQFLWFTNFFRAT